MQEEEDHPARFQLSFDSFPDMAIFNERVFFVEPEGVLELEVMGQFLLGL